MTREKFLQALVFPVVLSFCLALSSLPALSRMSEPADIAVFKTGNGPSLNEDTYSLLDPTATGAQSNAIAWEEAGEDSFLEWSLRCRLLVIAGTDGGGFAFLDTSRFGARGPAPFLADWAEPSLNETFAIGIDVHNPPTEDPFDSHGNYMGLPEREISLHWDGREIINRLVKNEFRGDFVELEVRTRFVAGGAEISVRIGQEWVYDHYFLPGIQPYRARLAAGASSSDGEAGAFAFQQLQWSQAQPAPESRRPSRFPIFNYVKSSAPQAERRKTISLPPLDWAYARVILTLQIHDAGLEWDGWDRNGFFNVIRPDGSRYDIAPFITAFRKPGFWQMNVTHFRPWLAGEVTLEIGTTAESGSQRYHLLSASLDFYHGRPDLLPYRVEPLWYGTATYGSGERPFGNFFLTKVKQIDASADQARLFITTTGHSPIGEFNAAHRTLTVTALNGAFAGEQARFKNTLWKEDVYLNPVRPQHGTWKYARAGWAPGSIVEPWAIDLTPFSIPGTTIKLEYETKPFDFSDVPEHRRPEPSQVSQAVHLVRSYLVFYSAPETLRPAPFLQIVEVAPGSNASKAGIKAGDYLVSYDRKQPETIDELLELIRNAEKRGTDSVLLTIHRHNGEFDIELAPGRIGIQLIEQ